MKNKIYLNIKILFVAVAVIIASITYVIFFQVGEAESFDNDGISRAVIIDQLYEDIPNDSFHDEAKKYLETAGYEVDIFTTKDVTVDFYKKLPQMNYKYIVIRTHGTDDKADNDVVLFTGEKYSEDHYISEQLFGQVKKATPLLEIAYSPSGSLSDWVIVNDTYRYQKNSVATQETAEHEYFAISPKLVKDLMNGKFDDTTFVLGGCKTLANPSFAASLINRGASTVVGWDNTVANIDNDRAILLFLKYNLIEQYDMVKTLDMIHTNVNPIYMPYPANFLHFDRFS